MIPYTFQYANPSDDLRDHNVDTVYGSIEKHKLDELFIHEIVEFMNELEYTPKSYQDFCNAFWKLNGWRMFEWYYMFKIYYFETTWIQWKVEDHQDEIYTAYLNKESTGEQRIVAWRPFMRLK